MIWKPFFYKWHKWCSVAAGLLTFIWFGSGVVMMTPRSLFPAETVPAARQAALPDFREAKITLPAAIAALEAATGQPAEITGVSLRRVHGRLLYSFSAARNGQHFIDAISGARFIITEPIAREIALASLPGTGSLRSGSKIEQHGWEYSWGPLPAYRFEVGDSAGTIFYVGVPNGDVRACGRACRVRGFLADTHTLSFLRPIFPNWSVKLVMLVFSIIGLAMTMLGSAILWLHFRNWWQGRWRTA